MSDAIYIPTPEAGPVGAHVWDGSDWQKMVGNSSGYQLAVIARSVDGVEAVTTPTHLDGVDPTTVGLLTKSVLAVFNETGIDRLRGNTEATLLASAVRAAHTTSADQINYNARGIMVYIDITVRPAAETITPSILVKDPVAGKYEPIVTFSAVGAVGEYLYMIYPGAVETAAMAALEVQGIPLPRTWALYLEHSGVGNFTYSAGGSYIV